MGRVIEVSILYHGRTMVLKVPEDLHENIRLHAENRKVLQNQVYCEAVDGNGFYAEQIRRSARIKTQI